LKGGAVARGRLDGNMLHDVTVIWRQVPKTIGRGHFGGRLVFAPDGKLFITSGDRQRFDPAQSMSSNLGKIVRINSDGSVPKDNPFVGKSNARDDIWTVGVRNPLGAAIHPTTGQLWYNDMGPKGGDEIVLVERGRNYGWPQVSEGLHYNEAKIPPHATRSEFTPPNYFWAASIAPAGFAFYTGNRFQGWNGNALIGGLVSKSLFRLSIDGAKVSGEERIAMNKRIRDVIQAPDGGILLLSDGEDGELLRLAPSVPTGARP
jgi:glucose/arabinose dehydrogenase